MIPHERSLVEKWKDKPFAILGVNSDRTNEPEGLENYKRQAKEMGVTWRSFQDESTTPKISDTWGVSGWPTLFFIDHKGVIRHKDVREEAAMEKALAELIAAAEKDQPKKEAGQPKKK